MAEPSLPAQLPERQISDERVQQYRDFYTGLIGFVPPRIQARTDLLARVDPELLALQEQIRAHCMYPECFDVKTVQLMLFGMLLTNLQDAAKLHTTAAYRAGATIDELTALGARLYPHCSALGKVLLAYRPEADVKRIVKTNGLPRFTPNTITEVADLELALAKVRKQGDAYDLQEIVIDLCCVGAPIRNYTGQIIAALSMSLPAYRFQRPQTEYRAAIVRAAQVVSERMGYYA